MKTLFALFIFAFSPDARAAALDVDRMIRVLVELEGGEDSDFGGAAHIGHQAWSDRTQLAYQLSKRPDYARAVYKLHLEWLAQTLRKARVAPTPRALATAWRWGFEGARRKGFRGSYGDRASALFYDSSFK